MAMTMEPGVQDFMTRPRHVPVLMRDVANMLARPNAVLIDGTVGDGGHAAALLQASGTGARLLGLDLDAEGLARTEDFLRPFGERTHLVHDTFARVADVAAREGFAEPTGILFDLGMSTHHLGVERGFSFKNLGSLDMRFDASGTVSLPEPEMPALRRLAQQIPSYTAADVLASLRKDDLAELLSQYGGERHADRIADAVATARRRVPIVAVPELVHLVVRALPPRARHGRIHAATKTFQALPMAVNRELESLRDGIHGALSLLAPGGRLAIITFHSGEDRLVKQLFRDAAREDRFILLTKHPVRPSTAETRNNRWSRSAHLRVVERHT